MNQVVLARRGDRGVDEGLLASMHRLRHQVFKERLNWQVESQDGMEIDVFDQCDPVYTVARDEFGEVEGCWRLLPTTGSNMLRDVFPELMDGAPVPADPRVWEISRFAVASQRREGATGGRYGFTEVPRRMMQGVVRFALREGIDRYVAVTSVAVERMLSRLGLHMSRLGAPRRIGQVNTVAIAIEIDWITRNALFLDSEEALRVVGE